MEAIVRVFIGLLLAYSVSACSTIGELEHADSISTLESTALAVVERRTAAYNAHDINAFIETYAPSVRIYEYPEKFLGEGTQRLRDIFGPQFAQNDGTIIVHRQRALENTVVSDETVTFYGVTEHNIGIYTIIDGLITEVRLIEPHE